MLSEGHAYKLSFYLQSNPRQLELIRFISSVSLELFQLPLGVFLSLMEGYHCVDMGWKLFWSALYFVLMAVSLYNPPLVICMSLPLQGRDITGPCKRLALPCQWSFCCNCCPACCRAPHRWVFVLTGLGLLISTRTARWRLTPSPVALVTITTAASCPTSASSVSLTEVWEPHPGDPSDMMAPPPPKSLKDKMKWLMCQVDFN